MKKIFWVVGEKSGDLHASYSLKELNKLDKNIYHYGVGGELMQNEGFHSMFEFNRFNVMGFVEVIKHINFFMKVEKQIKEILIKDMPDLLVLVDYPGLNLRIAKIAKSLNIKVLYYICPQFWAWKHKRVFKIKKYTDMVACINHFESPLLDNYHVTNKYVGHPVAEEISAALTKENFLSKFNIPSNKKIIGLFPGSRKMELKHHLPLFKKLIAVHKHYHFALSVSDKKFAPMFKEFEQFDNVSLVHNYNYSIMKHSDFLITKSGTTTLESALFTTPFVIIYKANSLSIFIAKKILNIKYIGLPNLISNKLVVKELIQEDANVKSLTEIIDSNLNDEVEYCRLKKELQGIKLLLGNRKASQEVSNIILDFLK